MPHTTRVLSTLAVALCCASPSLAYTEFRGGGFLTDFTNCGAAGWSGTERILLRYRPANADGNSNTLSLITIFTFSGALNYSFDYAPGTYPAVGEWFPVQTTQIFSGPAQYNISEMRILESSPIEAIAAGATAVFVTFELRNFGGDMGCQTRGRAALSLN